MNARHFCVLLIGSMTFAVAANADSPSHQGEPHKPRNPIPVDIAAQSDGRTTHLHVPVGQMVSIESSCLTPDNSSQNVFYYDRQIVPFSIPSGYSFIVTDVIVQPNCNSISPNPDAPFLAIVENQQNLLATRAFSARGRGDSTLHVPLSGGLAFTSDQPPRPRVAALPGSSHVEIQVLGYFIKGAALPPGQGFDPRAN